MQQQLGQQLGQLTALQHLEVRLLPHPQQQQQVQAAACGAASGADSASVRTDKVAQPAVAVSGAGLELAAALSGLPGLQSLQLEGLCMGAAAASHLASAGVPTRGDLQGCSQACASSSSNSAPGGVGEVAVIKVPVEVSRACVSIFVETA